MVCIVLESRIAHCLEPRDTSRGNGTLMQRDSVEKWLPPADWVVRELRRRISAGTYAGDTVLPGERRLAEEFGVGRRSVRAALSKLAAGGLITRRHGQSTRVSAVPKLLAKQRIGVAFSMAMQQGLEGRHILQGIQDGLDRLKCDFDLLPIVFHARDFVGDSLRIVRSDDVLELSERYGALIFVEMTRQLREPVLEMSRQGVLTVIANLEADADLTATWVDHVKPTRRAVEILAGFGHHRIAFVGSESGPQFYALAEAAFRRSLKDGGIAVDDSLIVNAKVTNPLDSYLAARRLFSLPDPPTAVVAARDILAMGVCRAIEETGARVGYEVSVIGFDDVTWPHPEPFLTTFREPCYEMGAVAAELLVDHLVNGPCPPEKRELEAELVLRRSAGPAP